MKAHSNLSPRFESRRELSRERFPRAIAALEEGVRQGVAPGMVAGLWTRDCPREIWLAAEGQRRLLPTGQELSVGTFFDLASLTKVCATAPLIARLIDRGWLGWDTPLQAFFPQAQFRDITITHLLSHTAGFVAWEPFYERLRESFGLRPVWNVSIAERQREARRLVLAARPEARPGERALYSDLSFLLLGFVIEEVTRTRFDRAVARFLWNPMGSAMRFQEVRSDAAAFRPSSSDEIAATEDSRWRGGILQGQVHDDNCWAMGGYAGHAGAFGRAEDVLGFVAALHSGFLSAPTLERMWARVPLPSGCERTAGWDTPSGAGPSSGARFSSRSVGHLGFTGTSLWIDRDAGLAVTLLTNRVHLSRENIQIRAFRPIFHDAIRDDLAAGALRD